MAHSSRIKLIAIASAAIIAIFFLIPSSPLYYGNKATETGIHLKACLYDSSGNELGCSTSQKVPIGQSVVSVGGTPISKVGIPSAYAQLNHTGSATSYTFTATELVQYDEGSQETLSISLNGSPVPKSFNITLPKSSWTVSELESKFTSQGTKLVNVTIVEPTITVTFANGQSVTKPSAFNYLAQFRLVYGETSTTTTSTSATTTTTSTSTTISDGGASTGATDAWATTVTSASSGSGSLSQTGIVMDCQPYAVQSGYTLCFVYIPPNYALPSCPSGSCGQVTIVSKDVAVGAFGLALTAGQWTQANIPIGTSTGDLVLAQVFQSNSLIYNQAITVSSPTTTTSTGVAQVPAAPYTDSYLDQIQASSVSTTTSSGTVETCNVSDAYGGIRTVTGRACLLSVSVTF